MEPREFLTLEIPLNDSGSAGLGSASRATGPRTATKTWASLQVHHQWWCGIQGW
uniref:Uncharacterized protein n=1 Tax=Anguilla anguilla TaxID=7936 RepID=A0A0E9VYN5_ANGAN